MHVVDDVDGVIVDQQITAQYDIGEHPIANTVPDLAGNKATCSFTITVIDADFPVMNCPLFATIEPTREDDPYHGYVSQSCDLDSSNVQAGVCGVKATDNVAVTNIFSVPSDEPLAFGDHTVTFLANDAQGNTARCEVVVTVQGSAEAMEEARILRLQEELEAGDISSVLEAENTTVALGQIEDLVGTLKPQDDKLINSVSNSLSSLDDIDTEAAQLTLLNISNSLVTLLLQQTHEGTCGDGTCQVNIEQCSSCPTDCGPCSFQGVTTVTAFIGYDAGSFKDFRTVKVTASSSSAISFVPLQLATLSASTTALGVEVIRATLRLDPNTPL